MLTKIRDKEMIVAESVLEAIRNGEWSYEPPAVDKKDYDATSALPGSQEKVGLMAARALNGLPLWHPDDRSIFDSNLS